MSKGLAGSIVILLFTVSATQADLLYVLNSSDATWASGIDQIRVVGTNGTDQGALVNRTINTSPGPIAQNSRNGDIYWTDIPTDRIYRTNRFGQGQNVAMNLQFEGDTNAGATHLAIDASGGRIYWSDTGNDVIRSRRLDGSDPQTLPFQMGAPVSSGGLYFDNAQRRLIFSERETESVYAHSVDSQQTSFLFSVSDAFADFEFGPDPVRPRAVSVVDETLYMVDNEYDMLLSVNLDGSDAKMLVDMNEFYAANANFGDSNSNSLVRDLVIENDTVYWVENDLGKQGIFGYNLSSSEAFQFFDTRLVDDTARPWGITNYSAVPEPSHLWPLIITACIVGGIVRSRRKRFASECLASVRTG